MSSRDQYRKKFAATNVAVIQEKEREVDSAIPSNKNSNERPGVHKVEEGSNYFRLAPAHVSENSDEQSSYIVPVCVSYLPAIVDERDDKGKPTGKKKKTVKPIFNSKVHGKGVTIDLVEEYIALATRKANEMYDEEEEKKSYLKYINGYREGNRFIGGIKPNTQWAAYGWRIVKASSGYQLIDLKRVLFKTTAKADLNKLSINEDSEGAIVVDPFTDIDEGIPVNYMYTSTADPKDKYSVVFRKDPVKNYPLPWPLSDSNLADLDTVEPLSKIYVNSFTEKDFELTVEGLQMFDDEKGYGLCSSPEWGAIVAELAQQIMGSEQEVSNKKPLQEAGNDSQQQEGSHSYLDNLNRAQLLEFIKDRQLSVIVTTSHKVSEIRERIIAALEAGPLVEDENDHSAGDEDDDLPF